MKKFSMANMNRLSICSSGVVVIVYFFRCCLFFSFFRWFVCLYVSSFPSFLLFLWFFCVVVAVCVWFGFSFSLGFWFCWLGGVFFLFPLLLFLLSLFGIVFCSLGCLLVCVFFSSFSLSFSHASFLCMLVVAELFFCALLPCFHFDFLNFKRIFAYTRGLPDVCC